MMQSTVKGVSISSSRFNVNSKQGCRTPLEVPTYRLSFGNRQRWYKSNLNSCHKHVIRATSSLHVDGYKNLIAPEKKQLREKRTSIKTLSLPVALESAFPSDDDDDDDKFSSFFSHMSKQIEVFYRFTRPHTIIGTLIGVTSVSLLPIQSVADLSPKFFVGLIKTLIPSVLMNIYVVGLNQLFDVQIDKVNKPTLPLASGEFSMGVGSTIVLICCIFSFAIGFASHSPPLIMALLTSFFLGSAYSIDLPMLRWKKQAFLAATCIVIVRAMVVQLAFFIHIQKYVLGREIMLSRSVIFATAFMCFFATVIALFKDIPDVDGDKYFGIQSFSVGLGKEKVFWMCIKMLLVAYGCAVTLGASSSSLPAKLVTVLGHSVLASILWVRAQSVDLDDNVSITTFYMFIWKLFYAEYFLIPFLH